MSCYVRTFSKPKFWVGRQPLIRAPTNHKMPFTDKSILRQSFHRGVQLFSADLGIDRVQLEFNRQDKFFTEQCSFGQTALE